MSDDDLIRRGDVLAVVGRLLNWNYPALLDEARHKIDAIPAATPRPMAEAPKRYKMVSEPGYVSQMVVRHDGRWVRWDDVAHLFAHPEAPK